MIWSHPRLPFRRPVSNEAVVKPEEHVLKKQSSATVGRGRNPRNGNLDKDPGATVDNSSRCEATLGPSLSFRVSFQRVVIMLILPVAVLVWAYFPTLCSFISTWWREPDYSHGFLVFPFSCFVLFLKRSSLPKFSRVSVIATLLLAAIGLGLRLFAGAFYYDSFDGYSLIFWIAALVSMSFGSAVLRWAAPSIAFLFFMVPLPYRVEGMLVGPLQRLATMLSTIGLQTLGLPAVPEGNVIWISDYPLEVAQACSGLRLFVSMIAIVFAYLMLVRRAWWERGYLLLSVIPVAIFSNACRIVATGLLFKVVSSTAAHKFSHDFAGIAMIGLASALFWVVLWYVGRLFPERIDLDMSTMVRRVDI